MERLRGLRRYIGTRAFYREMLTVSMPIALQQFVTSLVNSLDTVMIANWGGSNATAAISLANRYFTTFNMLMMALAVTCSVYIAQYYGAKQYHRLKQIFGINLVLTGVLALLAFTIGLAFQDPIIGFFTGAEAGTDFIVREYGAQYLGLVAFSFLPQAVTNALTFTYRPLRQTKIPLYSAITAAVTNALFNWWFIYGGLGVPAMGIQGAAYATIISRLFEMGVLLIYFFVKKPLFYGKIREIFSFTGTMFRDVITRGRPLLVSQALTQTMAIFMLFVFARIEVGNATNVAAFTVSTQLVDIVVVFIGGMGTAASVMIGSRLGANQLEEAKQNARYQVTYVILFSILASIVLVLLIPLTEIAFNFDPSEYELLSALMILHALSFPFMVYSLNIIFITRAGGYNRAPYYITNLVYYGIKLPIIIFFVYLMPSLFAESAGLHQGLSALGLPPTFMVFVFLIDRMMEVLRAIVAYYVYTRADWCRNIVKLT